MGNMGLWAYLLISIAVTWPPAIAGMWITWFLAHRKVQKVSDEQTADILSRTEKITERITERQTETLMKHDG